MWRSDKGFGIGRAAELEIQKRNSPDRPLFDDPGRLAVLAFLEKDAGHVGRDAEADIHRPAVLDLLRDATCDDLLNAEVHQVEAVERADQLARDRGVIGSGGGLQHVGRFDDVVDENSRNAHVMRPDRSVPRDTAHLCDDDAARVVGGKGHLHCPKISAFAFKAEIAALVRCGGANDRDIRVYRLEIKPVFAVEGFPPHDRFGARGVVHGAAVLFGIDECVHADLGQDARALAGAFAQHVEHDTGRDIVGRHLVLDDHLPDQRWIRFRGARRITPADDLFQASRLSDVIDAFRAEHVAGGDRMDRCQVARRTRLVEPFAKRRQNGVGTAKAAGGVHRNDRAILDKLHGFCRSLYLAHGMSSIGCRQSSNCLVI